jgi:hypothetical protein
MKTLIAIPCMDMLPLGFVQSLLYMNKGENPTVYFKPNSLIYDSRNLISLYAIENGFDNVMWLDSDIMMPPHTLIKLEAYNMDMVTGLYVRRHDPVEPVIYDELKEPERNANGYLEKKIHPYMDYPRDAFFPVAGCGFGCVLTSVKLLKEVWDHFGPAFTPYTWAGEDISFCHRVNQLGHQIYCDSSISCGHIGQMVYTEEFLKRGDNT